MSWVTFIFFTVLAYFAAGPAFGTYISIGGWLIIFGAAHFLEQSEKSNSSEEDDCEEPWLGEI